MIVNAAVLNLGVCGQTFGERWGDGASRGADLSHDPSYQPPPPPPVKKIKDLTGGDVPSTHSQVLVLTPLVSTPQPTLLSHQREGAVAWNFNKLFNIGKKKHENFTC